MSELFLFLLPFALMAVGVVACFLALVVAGEC